MGRMPDGMVNTRKENKIMLEKVKEIVAESLNVEESTLSETTSFKEDLGADSLDLFEMVMAFEEAFEVEIPSEDLEQITTVGENISNHTSRSIEQVENEAFRFLFGSRSERTVDREVIKKGVLMRTRITELLGIEYPIIQGGMAWVAEYHLAAAVSNAGGLGLIGTASAPAEWVREQIREAKKLTDKPFGINIMMISPYADEVAKVAVEEGVAVITTGAGSPEKYIKMWKEAGIKVIPVVASVAMAKRMQRCGADALVAEGTEAGGHIGENTTMVLVPQVVDAVEIPVIAAGGIADGRGIAAAFMLGAEGVQIGTRFVVTEEAQVHENYKECILKARDIDSRVTGRSTGHPVRALRNKMTKEYLEKEQAGATFEELEHLTLGGLRRAVVDGDVQSGSVMAGQIAGMIKEKLTCQEVIQKLVSQTDELIGGKGFYE